MCDRMTMKARAKQQPNKRFKVLKLSSLQGDVQEEGQGEEWSDAGRHPPWQLPAANVLRTSQKHAISLTSCLLIIYICKKNHSILRSRLNPSAGRSVTQL